MNENKDYLTSQLVTYIGNKRLLLPAIESFINKVHRRLNKKKLRTLDSFSGSGAVSRLMKHHSSMVYANDLEPYARVLSECYLANRSRIESLGIKYYHEELKEYVYSRLDKSLRENTDIGFISRLYSPRDDKDIKQGERVFYTNYNAHILDLAISFISTLDDNIKPFLLAPLLSEASIHVNTSGVFKGFYKDKNGVGKFGGIGENALSRILGKIELNFPVLSNHESDYEVSQLDAKDAIGQIGELDLAYLDPPYNQHPYGSNYFMLNLLTNYEEPKKISKVSGIPKDWNRSAYNKKSLARKELFSLIENINSRFILLSYNSEGFIEYDDIVSFLRILGALSVHEVPYNTFRGSRNLRNRNIHTTEYLFLLEKS